MTGIDQIRNLMKCIGWPSRCAMPATMTLAEAAISEPLPPKQAPSDKAHQTGIMASRPPREVSIDLIIGIMVATNGMLSMAVDTKADNQTTIMAAF